MGFLGGFHVVGKWIVWFYRIPQGDLLEGNMDGTVSIFVTLLYGKGKFIFKALSSRSNHIIRPIYIVFKKTCLWW